MAKALMKVGRYQIVSELGRGSMGLVYQAFDPVIGRTIAIKTMMAEGLTPAEYQEFKDRFQREAQSAGVLAHPNIVTVYDFGEDSGVLYLAMELLEGKSLDQMVQGQNVLPIETIIPMYEQVCSALDHAHTRNIVHRDIKPANIMILKSGLVKVMDFGIAKMMSMGMTQAGQILGTPNYMSPEQVRGRTVDGRSDIFSLGVILYELVTGEKPFGGQNITTVIYKIINENPIPPRELDAAIHPGLNYVINKALAKNPDDRYQTCRELAEDIRNYKNLDGAVSPGATVMMKVPAVQSTSAGQAEQPPSPASEAKLYSVVQNAGEKLAGTGQAPVDRELKRPLSVQVIPPARRQPRRSSTALWVFGTMVILGALGASYYYYSLVHKGAVTPAQEAATSTPAPAPAAASTSTSNPTPPASNQGPETVPGSAPPATSASTEGPAPTQAAATTATAPVGHEEPQSEPPAPSPSHSTSAGRETARSKVAAPKFGQLIVRSNVQGARISIDGRSGPGWVTPHTFTNFPAGTHLVVLSKEGFEEAEQSVTVARGRTASISPQLTVPSGEITIVTNPPGAQVFIDGRPYGASPVTATVSVGPHNYTVKSPGVDPYVGTFEMKDGALLRRTITLGGAPEAVTGIVEVRTIPPGATVFSDTGPVGTPTPTSFRIKAGHHTLIISSPGYRPIRRDIEVPRDGSLQVHETLPRQ